MSFPNREGTQVPETHLQLIEDGQLVHKGTNELFAGKKVVVFGLPGAFTPTCSTQHVPRYEQLFDTFAALGVDAIYCLSVNDAFVMDAWRAQQGVSNVQFLADGNGTFTEGLGLLVDKDDLGFGKRSWRHAMLVDDGVITKQFVEPTEPGDPYHVSDADTMLSYLDPNAHTPHDILLFTKPGCGHCARAKQALRAKALEFAEVPATGTMLRALSADATTPRVFIDGALVGGADELVAWLETQ